MGLKGLKAFMGNSSGLEDKLHNCPVFLNKAEFPIYNKLLSKGEAFIQYMSPDEYLMKCKEMKNYEKSIKEYIKSVIDQEKVNKYYQAMVNGEKFPLIMLDYITYMQEGRHRALAAKKYKIKKLPVIIVQ